MFFLSKPSFLLFLLLLSVSITFPDHADAQVQTVRPEVKNAIDKGLTYLLTQQRQQGCFLDENKDDPVPQHSGAMTSLVIMALSSIGHMPSDPTPEGRAVERALRFMTDAIKPTENGYLGQSDRSRMYGHGIMTLMFAEMIGQNQDKELDPLLRNRLQNAIDLIMRAQDVIKSDSNKGGWRYEPGSSDSDISVSVWQVMALRAANNAGLKVPKESIDKAVAYIKRSYRSDRDAQGLPLDMESGFTYEPNGGRRTFSTTAAGLLSLQVCAEYDAPEVIGGANFLMKNPPETKEPWFYYGTYYYSQSMHQCGGEQASTAREITESLLLPLQQPDGSWHPKNGNEKSAGPVYATALAVLSLSIHHHYLPIYQK
ncbi:hypothetical protein FEM03_15070 [Phragmitibacter flavus]|uniref:Uncharacterized protein n=1 Tax=Phragmitibacter flavus TaxID=2576071 RepID=A0A5R8KCL9_9BACT|nr:hypothetical protein [Phragmitibacter flavus]TLD70048.1 hypothetical protein FEM03_15070 [Phragmitibacter flavus]